MATKKTEKKTVSKPLKFATLAALKKAHTDGKFPRGFKLNVATDWVTAEAPEVEIEFGLTPHDFAHAAAKMLGMKSVDA